MADVNNNKVKFGGDKGFEFGKPKYLPSKEFDKLVNTGVKPKSPRTTAGIAGKSGKSVNQLFK